MEVGSAMAGEGWKKVRGWSAVSSALLSSFGRY